MNGIRTRGSQGPDDSQGHLVHMEYPACSFKLNPATAASEVKKPAALSGLPTNLGARLHDRLDRVCKKFSQIARIAYKKYSLLPKPTILASKYQAVCRDVFVSDEDSKAI
ncbi:hypothetical protein [Bradyrhizobium sp.]|uniref:hypothetical protein n=1 Tax=Bradyrhizobium sp. TaxID=376 RepID=UPI0025C4449E|nr:hypothetical protein [Bradyrhizobium sp.]